MKKGFKKLQQHWEENPEQVVMLGVAVLTSSALFISAVGKAVNDSRGRSIYNREIKRRERLTPPSSRYPFSR